MRGAELPASGICGRRRLSACAESGSSGPSALPRRLFRSPGGLRFLPGGAMPTTARTFIPITFHSGTRRGLVTMAARMRPGTGSTISATVSTAFNPSPAPPGPFRKNPRQAYPHGWLVRPILITGAAGKLTAGTCTAIRPWWGTAGAPLLRTRIDRRRTAGRRRLRLHTNPRSGRCFHRLGRVRRLPRAREPMRPRPVHWAVLSSQVIARPAASRRIAITDGPLSTRRRRRRPVLPIPHIFQYNTRVLICGSTTHAAS